jgi:hypothetical protein
MVRYRFCRSAQLLFLRYPQTCFDTFLVLRKLTNFPPSDTSTIYSTEQPISSTGPPQNCFQRDDLRTSSIHPVHIVAFPPLLAVARDRRPIRLGEHLCYFSASLCSDSSSVISISANSVWPWCDAARNLLPPTLPASMLRVPGRSPSSWPFCWLEYFALPDSRFVDFSRSHFSHKYHSRFACSRISGLPGDAHPSANEKPCCQSGCFTSSSYCARSIGLCARFCGCFFLLAPSERKKSILERGTGETK